MTNRKAFLAVIGTVVAPAFAHLAGFDAGIADAVKGAICEAPASE
jgi:hypothetical protein